MLLMKGIVYTLELSKFTPIGLVEMINVSSLGTFLIKGTHFYQGIFTFHGSPSTSSTSLLDVNETSTTHLILETSPFKITN